MLPHPLNRFRSAPPAAPAPTFAYPISLKDIGERTLTRDYQIDPKKINKENRTIEISFSSETEVPRWYDEIEVLDHSVGAADLDRLNNGGNLLFGHNPNDPIGVVEESRIDSDRKGRAVVRFSKSARGEEVWQDVQDGILRNVSFGYRVLGLELKEKRENGQFVYLVTRWEPFEISLVTIPADTNVGVDRQQATNPTPTPQHSQIRSIMNRQQTIQGLRNLGVQFDENATDEVLADLLSRSLASRNQQPQQPQQPAAPSVNVTSETQSRSAEQERDRVRQITAAGKEYNVRDIADKAIADGVTVEEFRGLALTEIHKRQGAMRDSNKGIGLSEQEVRQFSFCRLMDSLASPDQARLREAAAFEYEVINAATEQARGRKLRGVLIPADILNRDLNGRRRDIISVKGPGGGYTGDVGNTIATTLLSGSFIEMLRNKTTVMGRGLVLTGLEGDIDIPKQTGQSAAAWIGEDDDAPETDINFGLVGMTPKTVAGYSVITRKTLKQSSLDVDGFLKFDLTAAIGQAIDLAAFYGDGSGNMPIGIAHTAAINAVNFAGVQPTYAELVAMETALGSANIDASSAVYIGNAAFRGHCKTTEKFAGTGATIWEKGNTVNGYSADVTNQIQGGHVFFGDFAQFLIGLWGGLDLLVDPYSDSRKARLNISAFQDVDFVVRRPAAFALGKKPAGT